jgi:hypothetical protein
MIQAKKPSSYCMYAQGISPLHIPFDTINVKWDILRITHKTTSLMRPLRSFLPDVVYGQERFVGLVDYQGYSQGS